MESNLLRFIEEMENEEKRMKSFLKNTIWHAGGWFAFISFCFTIPVFLLLELNLNNDLRTSMVQLIIALFTFSVAIHGHELRALRSEKTRLIETVTNLDLKLIDMKSKQTDPEMQKSVDLTFKNAMIKLEGTSRKNILSRIVLYPTATLSILYFGLALLFSILAALTSGIVIFDMCSVSFLASGLFVLGFGLTKIIVDE